MMILDFEKEVIEFGQRKILKVGDKLHEKYDDSVHTITGFKRENRQVIVEFSPPITRSTRYGYDFRSRSRFGGFYENISVSRISINDLTESGELSIFSKEEIHEIIESICAKEFVHTKYERKEYEERPFLRSYLGRNSSSMYYIDDLIFDEFSSYKKPEPIYKLMSDKDRKELESLTSDKNKTNRSPKWRLTLERR